MTRWSLAGTDPNRWGSPADIDPGGASWIPATAPGTVAAALRSAGHWSPDRPHDVDARDWWYRCTFPQPAGDGRCHRLRFDGLATVAHIWLNGDPLLTTSNMFQTHVVDVSARLHEVNDLVICFRSLNQALATRRRRPRWKTRLVADQQLRWFRTTLLGRMPGWSPPIAPVGPWRAVALETACPGAVTDVDLSATIDGDMGVVDCVCSVPDRGGARVTAELIVGTTSVALDVDEQGDGAGLHGRLRMPSPRRWWPHTHGTPHLHPCRLHITSGSNSGTVDLGAIGFRDIAVSTEDGDFALAINGVPVFCRGGCWTIGDLTAFASDETSLARELARLRDAGANMIRIGGTMAYESDAFYRLCDELGLLVWQDFMFANMDYPADDPAFVASVEAEAEGQLRRLRRHPCMTVYCGNSEVEQQAAMLGIDPAIGRNPLFVETLPRLCRAWHPQVPYVPASPSGGVLPFHADHGISHYYGVGAYLRPLDDARRSRVRFAAECLAFANVPDDEVVREVMDGAAAVHQPRWKSRTPRDSGAGWDFEDVRDHYLRELFGEDPVQLRSRDTSRYLELGRVTTGEVMARVFSEWRSARSTCRGGLVWFLKDLWAGAGWGVLDSRGLPKACFHYLRRVWQPQAVVLTDEGVNGLDVHVINERDTPLVGTLELTLVRDGRVVTGQASSPVLVHPRTTWRVSADALLGRFTDIAYAYRFGPPAHDVAAATLHDPDGAVCSEAIWMRDAAASARRSAGAVLADPDAGVDGAVDVTVNTEGFLFAAHVDVPGFLADEGYFSLLPGRSRVVHLRPLDGASRATEGELRALNLDQPVRIRVPSSRGVVMS